MKPTTLKSTKSKLAVPLIFLVIFSLTVWFAGAQIAIAGHTPLAAPVQRFYVISAVFLLWFLKYLFIDTATSHARITTASSETMQKIELLKNRFQGAIEFLKKTHIKKSQVDTHLAELPWYLVMGPEGAGKTTLLANSNIHFILSKQFKAEQLAQIPASDSCDWWVTRDSVMVDVPGTYLNSPKKNQEKNPAHLLWRSLLNLIKTTPAVSKLNGVIITLNLPELMKKQTQDRDQHMHDVRRRMMDLRATFGTDLPFYLVITKCDLLPGFLEFFSEDHAEDLAQAWGIALPVLSPNEKLLDVFNQRFNALIKRLNKQLLWRIHQERNPLARPYIKDFPLHVERLKETIVNFLKALMMPDLRLHGVYLTSAIQKNVEENATYLTPAQGSTTGQALQIMRTPVMPMRPHFIKQVLMQGVLQSFAAPQKSTSASAQYMAYAASISVAVLAAALLGHDFQRGVQKTYSIQNDLAHYQLYMQQSNDDTGRLVKALPLLDSLQQAAAQHHQTNSVFKHILSFYSSKSQQTADTVYHRTMQTIVLPEIKNDLEKYLQTAANKNPDLVYTALKAYLMLHDEKNRDSSFIANTLNLIVSTPLNRQAVTQLTTHINMAFSNSQTSLDLDSNLIAEVRKQLVNLSSDDLGMLILKNYDTNNADSAVELGTNTGNPPIFVSRAVANRIPNMFTADYFSKIISTQLDSAANEAIKGNWVLGDVASTPNQPTLPVLTAQLHNRYVANYIDIWESLLANIQPYTPKNLLQTDRMIVSLTNNNSPLLHLLQTIKQNTAIDPVLSASPKLQALNNLIGDAGNDRQNSLYQVFVNLRQLHSYLQTVLSASDTGKSAFEIASQRMQNSTHDPITEIHHLAEQTPEPMKTWLDNIANQSWDFILHDAAAHIDTAWQNKIFPAYNADIYNRYPFNQTAHDEVNLVKLTSFLGHQGDLANFYMSYLKPFINDTRTPWVWRSVDDRKVPFSNTLLADLEHAYQLQQTFFPYKDNKLSVLFTLRPVALDATVKSFELNMNGSSIYLAKNGTKNSRVLTWPGSFTNHGTSMNMVTSKNQTLHTSLTGDWAWFKLVNNSVRNMNAQKELLLTFNVNGRKAQYALAASGQINPFIPVNLSTFELPQTLMEKPNSPTERV